MNVGELIQLLQKFNPKDEIYIFNSETDTGEVIDDVRIRPCYIHEWTQIIHDANDKRVIVEHESQWVDRLVIE